MDDTLNPPWLAYPEFPAGSSDWAAGDGRLFLDMFYAFYGALNEQAAVKYAKRYPEPESWLGTYASIRKEMNSDNG